jgi:hypothetical protein
METGRTDVWESRGIVGDESQIASGRAVLRETILNGQ